MSRPSPYQVITMSEDSRLFVTIKMHPNEKGTLVSIERDEDAGTFSLTRSLLMAAQSLSESKLLQEDIQRWVDRMDAVEFEADRRAVIERLARLISDDEPARAEGGELPF